MNPNPYQQPSTSVSPAKPTAIIAGVALVLVAINVIAGLVWIETSYAVPLARASEKYGHVTDPEKRLALMDADMDADREKARPYFWAFATITGVNAAIAVAFAARAAGNRLRARQSAAR